MSFESLIPLIIVLPILGATVPLILSQVRNKFNGSLFAVVLLGFHSFLCFVLAREVFGNGELIYQIGGEALSRPEGFAVGIELLADEFSVFLVSLTSFVAFTTLIYIRKGRISSSKLFSGILLLVSGVMGVFLTHDIFNLFVFMEITGLATYALIASGNSKESSLASLNYLLIGTVGASLYLLGVGYIYMATGTLNMSDLSLVLAGESFIEESLYSHPLVHLGFGFMAVGLLIKCAIFPLHSWQPEAYRTAPDGITALIAALVSTASAYVLGRLVFTVFTPEFFVVNPIASELLIVFASISVIAGTVLAVMQTDIKRMFAYSSVSHFGLIVAAFGAAVHPSGSLNSLIGGIIHLGGHSIMKAGLFIGAGVLIRYVSSSKLRDFGGLGSKLKLSSGGLILLGISLIGIPPSIGFIGKWFMILGALEAKLWFLVLIILLSTLLTLAYIAKLVETLYFKEIRSEVEFEDFNSIRIGFILVLVYGILSIFLGFTGSFWFEIFETFGNEVLQK